ncbi:MAG: type II toxin-antitoxin system VapC family toxin [Actinomycetota bacterium]|nr:type II toxin-antitoxin system VapC family toxin [Actinomycetota bacterium]
MTLVVDSSAVVAALVDIGSDGTWAETLLMGEALAAPHLMPAEVANILRRLSRTGELSADVAALAYADLAQLRVEFFPYEPFSERIWALRDNVTAYDAWYVALAEWLDARLITLDAKLSRASGPRCAFELPS